MSAALYFASDDTQISESGVFTNAVEFTLRLDLEEVGEPIRLYAMAATDFELTEGVVTPTGTTANKWELAPDADNEGPVPGEWEDPAAPINLGTVGEGMGGRVYFWVRAFATADEVVENDVSVTLRLQGILHATD